MRHVPDGTIRRLVDEPFAVSDEDAAHVAGCSRCRSHRAAVEQDAGLAAALLTRPQPVPDIAQAWQRLQAASMSSQPADGRHSSPVTTRPPRRFGRLALPQGAVIVTAAVVVAAAAGAGLAVALLGPTRPAPAKASTADFSALADLTGVDDGAGVLGGFRTPSGTLKLPFGVLKWSSSGPARALPSLQAARAATGLDVVSPGRLPAGVGKP
ncbi:MAG TPA: hypothetical protein VGP46_01060, partial [Acidimicrobiales bacterium]|nr:hypothetical protein [Acidimicrobiales bacterium]